MIKGQPSVHEGLYLKRTWMNICTLNLINLIFWFFYILELHFQTVMWRKTTKLNRQLGEIWQMWLMAVNFAAIKLVFLSHFAQDKYLLTRIMKPADHLGWNQIFTITFLSFSPPHYNLWIIHMKKTKYIKGLLWQHLVCLQKMPVTGTRHKSHNLSSDLTASHFASQKPPN